jgi:hypothetical protein
MTNRPGKVILLGWEMGGGLGHVHNLLAVARGLADRGHFPVCALRNVIDGTGPLRDQALAVVQAPVWQPRPLDDDRAFLASSYADVLAVHGYDTVEHLLPLVEAWQGLLDFVRPALVVLDFAPTLALAATGAVPMVEIGTGFTMPPLEGATFPALIPDRAPVLTEEALLAVVAEVQRRRGRPVPASLPAMLAGPRRFLTVLPELDPYRAVRREQAVGCIAPAVGPPLPPAVRPGFFAYLNAAAGGIEALLRGLGRAGLAGTAYLRAATPALRARLRAHGLNVLDRPPPLGEMLAENALVVHHGGSGLAHYALAAGRPQLVFPEHLEQILNGQLLHGLGVGRYLVGRFAEERPAQELARMLHDDALAERCRQAAASVQARGPWTPQAAVLEHCLTLLEPPTASHQ